MDVTPELLTEYKFKEEWRGYNRDEVDDFLERLAAALGELQSRFEQMSLRAERAERNPPESGGEEQLRRTLVLAQRTADAAIAEAREEAEQLVADARARAQAILGDAEQRAAALEAEVAERTRTELGSIATRRAELSEEVEALDAFVAEHRGRLQAELREQLNWLARPGRLQLPPAPALSPLPEAVYEAEEPVDAYTPPEAPALEPAAEAYAAPIVATYDQPVADDSAQWEAWQQELAAERVDIEPRVDEPTGEVQAVEVNGFATAANAYNNGNEYAPDGAYRYADTPAEEPADEVHPDLLGIDDDPFLAELRRAVTDPEPLGPRESDRSGWDNGPVSGEHFPAADLFGRKRRR